MTEYKSIIGTFLKIDPSELRFDTPIDRSALQGSILLHRMHAKLAQAGCHIDNWSAIRTLGDLERTLNVCAPAEKLPSIEPQATHRESSHELNGYLTVGIDIEEIANLPVAEDYREHPFYQSTFTPQELSYCILQVNSLASLAGLFAAKEAIVKTDGGRQYRTLKEIAINHAADGKPTCPGFELSISHTTGNAVAVAVRIANQSPVSPPLSSFSKDSIASETQVAHDVSVSGFRRESQIAFISLLFSFVALAVVIIHLIK